jgi:adenosylcobinamide-GDP ribazoletransferase
VSWRDPIRLAVGTLTVLPVGAISRIDSRVAGTAMLLAPLAVLPLALVASAVGGLARLAGVPPLVCGLLVVAALALGTRALHLDGLADTVDGLGSGWDRDRALTVMRRGDVGPMGVTALILMLGVQGVAMGQLAGTGRGLAALAALICCSRASLSLVCRAGVPAARADGLGAGVAGSVPGWAAAATWVVVTAALALLATFRGQPWWSGVAAAAAVVVVVTILVRRCVRRFGGVTGDVMGAAVELSLTVLAVVAAR